MLRVVTGACGCFTLASASGTCLPLGFAEKFGMERGPFFFMVVRGAGLVVHGRTGKRYGRGGMVGESSAPGPGGPVRPSSQGAEGEVNGGWLLDGCH